MKAFGLQRKDTAGRTIRGTTRPCPCCLRVGPAEELVVERAGKKRQRVMARMEIASDLLDMALEAEGVSSAWEPYQKFRISHAWMQKRTPGFDAWDRECRYDYYDYDLDWCDDWSDPWDDYKDWLWNVERDDRLEPVEARWVELWVDGRVETPYDWRDYRDDPEYYCWTDDYDFETWNGEEEFWWGSASTEAKAPPSTEVLVRERASEKLRAGNRYYMQNRRVAA